MFDLGDILGQLRRPVEWRGADALQEGIRQLGVLRAAVAGCEARLLAEFQRCGGVKAAGATDVGAWLASTTGEGLREAAARAGLARTVEQAPDVGDALLAGAITAQHAATIGRALTRTPATENHLSELLSAAQATTADEFARQARAVELRASNDAGADAGRARAKRSCSVERRDDGTGTVSAVLPLEEHAEVSAVLDSIAEELWRAEHGAERDGLLERVTLSQRRADALVEMARRARGVSRGNRDRARVHVLLDEATLRDRLGDGAYLSDGTPIAADTARRLACTAGIIPWVLSGDAVPLDRGRDLRYATKEQVEALVARDGPTCVFPDCQRPWQWCDAHHLLEWDEQDGPTDLVNLALVCDTHHHLVHEGHWQLEHTPQGAWRARSPGGHVTGERPPHHWRADPPSPPPGDPPRLFQPAA